MTKNFADANVQQFMSDLGMSGNQAIPPLRRRSSIGAVTSRVKGSPMRCRRSSSRAQYHYHVNSVDDALAADRVNRNRQALQFVGRL